MAVAGSVEVTAVDEAGSVEAVSFERPSPDLTTARLE